MKEFILFSDRMKLAKGYQTWVSEVKAKDCPLNVVNYLYSIGRLRKFPLLDDCNCEKKDQIDEAIESLMRGERPVIDIDGAGFNNFPKVR